MKPSSATEQPFQRHSFCEVTACRVCLEDTDRLAEYLEAHTEAHRQDHLGQYHAWLGKNGKIAETEHGWWHPDAYVKENMDAYIKEWHGE